MKTAAPNEAKPPTFLPLFSSLLKGKYASQFTDYPGVLTLEEFRSMLGGIADTTARKSGIKVVFDLLN